MNVLAVGAHPDDIEIGCGGTLLAHKAAGDTVTMLVLTDGRGNGHTLTRRAEQTLAAEVLGANLEWGDQEDGHLTAEIGTVHVIERVMARHDIDMIYVHDPADSHQDHRAASAAALSAGRQLARILYYQSPSTEERFAPTVFVDIASFLSSKEAALTCHSSQVRGSLMVEPDTLPAFARYWGAQSRVGLAEAFRPARLVFQP